MSRHHHYRDLRVLTAQQHQPGETVSTWHVQVEQHQIPIGLFRQLSFQLGNTGDLDQANIRTQTQGNGLVQGTAKQRMVISNQDVVCGHCLNDPVFQADLV